MELINASLKASMPGKSQHLSNCNSLATSQNFLFLCTKSKFMQLYSVCITDLPKFGCTVQCNVMMCTCNSAGSLGGRDNWDVAVGESR